EYVDAVRAGEVVQEVAVQIRDGATGRCLDEGSSLEMTANIAAELKRYAIARRELQIGDTAYYFRGEPRGLLEPLRIQRRQAVKADATLLGDVGRGAVRPKYLRLVVLVERHQTGEPARDARMSCKRRLFGARQIHTQLQSSQQQPESGQTEDRRNQ